MCIFIESSDVDPHWLYADPDRIQNNKITLISNDPLIVDFFVSSLYLNLRYYLIFKFRLEKYNFPRKKPITRSFPLFHTSVSIRIRIRNADPDPHHWYKEANIDQPDITDAGSLLISTELWAEKVNSAILESRHLIESK